MKAKSALIVVGIAFPAIIGLGIWSYCQYQEQLRVRDADSAFKPLASLAPIVLSQPCGTRYCRYVLELPAQSGLNDDNAAVLQSLNSLPTPNTLDVTISTERITDASLPVLASLRSVDLLDVTKSGVTDQGISKLQTAMPNVVIPTRK